MDALVVYLWTNKLRILSLRLLPFLDRVSAETRFLFTLHYHVSFSSYYLTSARGSLWTQVDLAN